MSEYENFNDPNIYKKFDTEILTDDITYISFLKYGPSLMSIFFILGEKITRKESIRKKYLYVKNLGKPNPSSGK